MRMKELKIDGNGSLSIDTMELDGHAVIIDSGKAKLIKLHDHGEAKIITHQGKVKRVRFEEGEEF
ncbi:XtrA/YqaO family protein [Jeotgalibacillus sp. ET6]|uniref:XtrA/YqaO family protein n=1 Tax=Jeotgalibacillus sp. ET6 TaxID=3037260 RepID=UPI00241832F3|nr:XtrA/YqaO family protein [Jeotgalibacillus sp. ET6]MDG5470532.1 XtrA/YqaO family protein [Jeotgalibacillus sp. ET6]